MEEEAESKETVGMETKKYSYKYSGYIDLTKTKVYRPNITERMEDEKRNYKRHIEKWSVRGHHRTVNGKSIWIDEHEKGTGKLEKRIYGTIPEKELNLMPQIFEVETQVKGKSVGIAITEAEQTVTEAEAEQEPPITQYSNIFEKIMRFIVKYIKKVSEYL